MSLQDCLLTEGVGVVRLNITNFISKKVSCSSVARCVSHMALKVYLDAETLPPDRSDPAVGEFLNSCTEEEFRQLSLNPQYGRILCIGVIVEQDNQITQRGVIGRCRETGRFHLDEERTLRAFWKLLRGFDPRRDLLIGFNLLDFDLHFICTRSVIRRVKPSLVVCFARYRAAPVFDCMWEFTHWRHRIKLDDLAKVLGMVSPKQEGVDGSRVYDLFVEGRHQEIADYVMRDCECTRAIHQRLIFDDT